MVILPTMDVVRRGILIGCIAKLGSGSDGVSAGRKLSGGSALLGLLGHLRWCLPI
jgi:hypothetical protein